MSRSLLSTISLAGSLLLCTGGFLAASPTKVVFATDIGGDIDDTWALAHILRSPELELEMILTETGEAEYRGMVAAKVLEQVDISDVTIALGVDFGVMKDDQRHQGPWVEKYSLDSYTGTIREDGVDAFIELIESSEEPIAVIAVGPVPSLAAAVQKRPDIAAKCDFYGMFGSFYIGYDGAPEISAEYNIANNVEAFRTVMAAEWNSVTLTPLDTCGLFYLSGENYHKIWSATSDPLLRSVIENYCIWAPRVPWIHCDFFTQKSSTLFDDVAVYMVYDGSLLEYESLRFNISDKGETIIAEDGKYAASVAVRWKDMEAFGDFLVDRLLNSTEAD